MSDWISQFVTSIDSMFSDGRHEWGLIVCNPCGSNPVKSMSVSEVSEDEFYKMFYTAMKKIVDTSIKVKLMPSIMLAVYNDSGGGFIITDKVHYIIHTVYGGYHYLLVIEGRNAAMVKARLSNHVIPVFPRR